MWTRKAIILAKKEVTYGTDIVPVAATNAIMCSEPQIKPLFERLDRNYAETSLSHQGHFIVGKMYEITFTTEIKGSGVAGTAPEIGPLFEGAAHAETLVVSTSAAYDPVSENFDSLSIYFHRDGIQHKIIGARGTKLQAVLNRREFGVINWTFQGLYAGPADVAYPSPTYNATLPPRVVGATFTMGGYSPIASRLEINIDNKVGVKDDINSADGILEVILGADKREVKGSFDPEVVALATKDFWSEWEAGTEQALSCLVGATAGNKYTISGAKCVYDEVGYGDRSGLLTYQNAFSFKKTSGDDEHQFLFT